MRHFPKDQFSCRNFPVTGQLSRLTRTYYTHSHAPVLCTPIFTSHTHIQSYQLMLLWGSPAIWIITRVACIPPSNSVCRRMAANLRRQAFGGWNSDGALTHGALLAWKWPRSARQAFAGVDSSRERPAERGGPGVGAPTQGNPPGLERCSQSMLLQTWLRCPRPPRMSLRRYSAGAPRPLALHHYIHHGSTHWITNSYCLHHFGKQIENFMLWSLRNRFNFL